MNAALALCLLLTQNELSGQPAKIYEQAKAGKWFSEASKLQPTCYPTTDGKSFFMVWKPAEHPAKWIVSLHGSHGFATDDLAIWHSQLEARKVGLICLQWWMGSGDSTSDYYTPEQSYREIQNLLRKLDIPKGKVMLHGFSRGAANSYAIMALDAGTGSHYFSLAVASSGGVGVNYPPNKAIQNGSYGDQPLKGTKWITCAGATDPNPDRDGITGMRKAGQWLKEQSATVLEQIEDPTEGHGALQRNPKNARHVLDSFLALP